MIGVEGGGERRDVENMLHNESKEVAYILYSSTLQNDAQFH